MAIAKAPGTWTYEDLLSLPDDGKRYEIIEGELYEMPSPSWDHSTIVMNLIALLLPIISGLGGQLRTAPLDVFFGGIGREQIANAAAVGDAFAGHVSQSGW